MRLIKYCLLILAASSLIDYATAIDNSKQFPDPQEDFVVYKENVLSYISHRSLPQRSEAQIKLNLPFQLTADSNVPYRGKFLLFHGLNDSTYVWTDVAKSLSQRGFDVRAVLLPGHGSHPDEMLDISYKQWLSAARQHYKLWNADNTPLYLGGFSLGAVIATILALEHPSTAGLLLISPAYESKLKTWLRWSWLYSIFKPYMFGGLIIEDNPTKYNSIPINSTTQYYKTTKYLKQRWADNRLAMPVLMLITMQDSVVDVDYVRDIFQKRFTSDKKRLLIYSDQTSTTAGQDEIIRFSYFPRLRILNQSHLSLMNAPENSLLGESKNLLICNGNEYKIFMACMHAKNHWYGAQHTPSPDGVSVARTTYNPDYASIEQLIEQVFF